MKRVLFENLMPADIVLTARRTKTGKAIRVTTWGQVSHAMICVQHGSVIDSTPTGVHSRSLQREMFDEDEKVFVFRLRERPAEHVIARIVDEARNAIGARYSKREAARALFGRHKPRNRREFCSRLVARAYRSGGILLVPDGDYCTPDALRRSPLLIELEHSTVPVLPEELAALVERPSAVQPMEDATNAVLDAVRALDPSVETFTDVDQIVEDHPEWDEHIAEAFRDAGYLTLWQLEEERHPYRTDIAAMNEFTAPNARFALRRYCVDTIKEAFSGGVRFAVMLRYHRDAQERAPRTTRVQLIQLYTTLVERDYKRREVARAWLLQHFPGDVALYMERIEPHSELWFSIVDCVEPALGRMARMLIARRGSIDICSLCGDSPARDYRPLNGSEAMPGVPALRLCGDCRDIRRGFGEQFEIIASDLL